MTQGKARVPWKLARRYQATLVAGRALKARKGQVTNELLARAGEAGTIVATDPATGREVKVATRTSGPRTAYLVPAQDEAHQVNPSGWAKRKTEREKARAELGS